MQDRFRSIEAFRSFEETERIGQSWIRGGRPRQASTEAVSPLRVLAAVKRHPEGVRRGDLASDLAVSLPAINEALSELLEDQMVHVERGDVPGEDLILP